MLPVLVEPAEKEDQFVAKDLAALGHSSLLNALGSQCPYRPLHDGNASVLTDRTVSRWFNTLAPDPIPTCIAIKDLVAIADDVPWFRTGTPNRAAKQCAYRLAVGVFLENAELDDPPRKMVDDHRDPPGKGPGLRNREWKPTRPETRTSGHRRQINMPNVLGALGRNHASGFGGRLRFGRERFFQDSSDGRRSQV